MAKDVSYTISLKVIVHEAHRWEPRGSADVTIMLPINVDVCTLNLNEMARTMLRTAEAEFEDQAAKNAAYVAPVDE